LETRQLPLQTPFYLLVEESEIEQVEKWGETSCKTFEKISYEGLPRSWHLYRSKGALDDKGVHGKYDVLSQPREAHITLDGGVRVRPRTNEYFVFAPPSIRVRGGGTIEVYLGDSKLEKQDGELYRIPEDFQTEGEYRITAKAENEIVKRKYFFLQSQTRWKKAPAVTLNRFGLAREQESQETNTGKSQEGSPSEFPLNLLPDLLLKSSSKVYLIGATPGQVLEWPNEGLPEDWQAVWAVPKGGQARYCWPGNSPPDPQPVPDLNRPGGLLYPLSKINSWKQVLYHWRRRTKSPEHHARLWRQYQNHAQDKC